MSSMSNRPGSSDGQGGQPGATPKSDGVILLYHGSPEPRWLENAEWMSHEVEAALPGVAIQFACLKEIEPSIMDAAQRLAGAGVTHALVVPMFIAPGGHAAKDFPILARELSARWPHVQFRWTDVVGGWEEVARAVGKGISSRL